MTPVLQVTDLKTSFRTDDGVVQAVNGVSFSVEKGRTLGIVGESGSGKSVTSLTVMGLNDKRAATSSGSVLLEGREILGIDSSELQQIRGTRIAMIFQDPMTSLNPVKRVGWQLAEAVLVHNDVTKTAARDRAIELLTQVGVPNALAACGSA
jgi:peptide/nickel transport system ATP-binding protein